MKRLTIILILLLLFHPSHPQNLISNGSFEDIDSIPYDLSQINFAKKWFGYSSDLFSIKSKKPNPYLQNKGKAPSAVPTKSANFIDAISQYI